MDPQGSTAVTPRKEAESQHHKQIRAVHNEDSVRVYQAYNDAIADSAVAAQSFRAPLDAGLWSKTRMTWIKPSKVWMAYRCGWTELKDRNQSRVLALDISRSKFEGLLLRAVVTTHDRGKDKKKCRDSSVVVQWDPERSINLDADSKQVFTSSMQSVRSIQIGLRGSAVEELLDPEVVTSITDVTQDFRKALEALKQGDKEKAEKCLWPEEREEVMEVPPPIQEVLGMIL